MYNKLVKVVHTQNAFGQNELNFCDFDGQKLALVEAESPLGAWCGCEVPIQNEIRSIYSIELYTENCSKTREVLELLCYSFEPESLSYVRFYNRAAPHACYVDVKESVDVQMGIMGAGTVHHVAFRVPDTQKQENVRQGLIERGLSPTSIIDRRYFTCVYFREYSVILFEIATNQPGFTVDEELFRLGSALLLPPQYEVLRSEIEKQLPAVKFS